MMFKGPHFKISLVILLPVVLLALPGKTLAQAGEGFLKASGKQIVDGNSRPVLLRGMGLGGWMLQEGYMLETGDFAGTQHEIRARIQGLVGQEGTDRFYNAWLANHVTKADIDSMAAWGFNSVRPALHYNLFTLPIEDEPVGGRQTWIEKGFVMLDSLVSWCAANRMYVILDLHAAPGGQGRDNNISDRDPNKPSLWESQANRIKTVELWKRLAERYANEPWIGGYDILNEPNWDFEESGNANGCNCTRNQPLLELYRMIITAIRSKDPNHLIFIEGNCWGGNFNGLYSLATFDRNIAFSFHRYWNRNDVGTIQEKLDIRNNYNIPLWMGESGENSNHWFADAISLLERHDIGWSWWPEKKINSVVGPLTVVKTPEYQTLLGYWRNGGSRPDSAFAMSALMKIADNLKIANCIAHPDVIDAMFRQQTSSEPKAFKTLNIPGTIHLVDFDMGRNGIAYRDADYENSGGLGSSEWNKGWVYRNDGPDIEPCRDSAAYNGGYNIYSTEKGEWLGYSFNCLETGVYRLSLRTASASGMGAFRIEIDGVNVTGSVAVPHSGSFQRFFPLNLNEIKLAAGTHRMVIHIEEGGFSMNTLAFAGPTGAAEVPFSLLSAKTDDFGRQVILTFNRPLASWPESTSGFILKSGNQEYHPDSLTADPTASSQVILWFSKIFSDKDRLSLSCSSRGFISNDRETLEPFTDLPVVNTIIARLPIPGIIEAEDYGTNVGFGFEPCSDAGGGMNAGWTEAGDYLDFPVSVAEKALYRITYRYSCNASAAQAELLIGTGPLKPVHTVNFSGTGGWQNWTSVTLSDTLPEGPGTLRFRALTSGFNLNRLEFIKVPNADTTKPGIAGFKVYPNPASDFVIVEITNPKGSSQRLELFDLAGRLLYRKEPLIAKNTKLSLDTTGYLPGLYLVRVDGEEPFGTRPLFIKNLKP